MAGCKRCALKGEKGKGKRRENKRKKEEKWGSKSFFVVVVLLHVRSTCGLAFFTIELSHFNKLKKKPARNLSSGIPPSSSTKRAVQPQKMK